MLKKYFSAFLLIILNVYLINGDTNVNNKNNEINYADFVTDLTPNNFYRELHFKSYFTLFYIPWCKHSKMISHIWEQLGEYFYNKNRCLHVSVGKVDCAKYHTLCLSNGVTEYPKIQFFRVKRKYDVIPYRKEHDLIEYHTFASDLIGDRRKTHDEIIEDLQDYIHSSEPLIDENYFVDIHAYNKVYDDDDDKEQLQQTDHVYELNKYTFDVQIESGTVFIDYYTPACEYCEKLQPVWLKLATKFHNKYSQNVKIAKVNCLQNQELCAQETNNAFPALIIYYNGLRSGEYEGDKFNLEKLYDYVKIFIPNDEL